MKGFALKKLLPILLTFAGLAGGAAGQDLQTRLEQQTDFLPTAGTPVNQLVEVARRFQIPMAIEWLEQGEAKSAQSDIEVAPRETQPVQQKVEAIGTSSVAKVSKPQSVLDLIRSIVRQSPDQQVLVEDNLVHVFSQSSVTHSFNFLNLHVDSFGVRDESLYGAQHSLALAINMTLHPELYKDGYGGGYGGFSIHDPDGVFYIQNITFSGESLTIREILNQIAVENGNSLWVVGLKPAELAGERPHWEGRALDEYGHSPLSSRWEFIPLAGLAQLAKEQVNVELTIAGFFTARKFVFPVVMEHGRGRRPGNGNGISTSDGNHCTYSVAVKDVRPDGVTLLVNVSVKSNGRAEIVFNKEIEVVRGKVSEQQVNDVIQIKTSIERSDAEPK